jgi:sarcosine oxidase subunit delta
MLRIPCPFCGLRDHSEFVYEGDATVDYPALDAPREAWFEAVFLRDNPRGAHLERWHHVQGCRALLIVERDTLTHAIGAVRLAHPGLQGACS